MIGIIKRSILIFLLFVGLRESYGQTADQKANDLQNGTYTNFLSADGTYYTQNNTGNTGYHYWWLANGLEALTDGYLRTRSNTYRNRMKSLLNGIKLHNVYGSGTYRNDYYDDMEWLAIACLRAYDATNDQEYLDVAKWLWTDIKTGYINGAVSWNKSCYPGCKNSIANSPAIIVAARLYRLEGNAANLQFARDVHAWMKSTVINDRGGVWDSPTNFTESWQFSYNLGMYIGASLELYQITGSQTYMDDAIKSAEFMMNYRLYWGGVAFANENGGGDGGLFKGIFMRYFTLFARLGNLTAQERERYMDVIRYTADFAWEKAVDKTTKLINKKWDVMPANPVDYSTQLSGVMLMEAAASIEKVHVYRNINYGGAFSELVPGSYTLANLQALGVRDNDITSLSVPAGYTVILYENDNFSGASRTITSNSTWLGDWNDRATSLIIRKGGYGFATYYTDCNYAGTSASFQEGSFKTSELVMYGLPDNSISSAKVLPGYITRVYKNDNSQGESLLITANDECLVNEGFNDNISSVFVRAQGIAGKSGTYFIKNRATGLHMNLTGGALTDGTKINQQVFNATQGQQFTLTESGNGVYKITSVRSGKPLDITTRSMLDEVPLQQWTEEDIKSQQFILINPATGYYQFVARHSGKVLEVKGSSSTVGTVIQQYTNNTQNNSLWKMIPTNDVPVVSITAPTNNAVYNVPGSISIAATATDAFAEITKVEFYNGTTKLGEDATSPYTYNWTNVAAGTYTITAKAINEINGTTTSAAITVKVNRAPTITIASPSNNATYVAAANITFTANASDTDGNITKVEFYNGTTKLGEDETSPYTCTWTNVGAGTYTITAKAYDNNNASTTSTAITVRVNANQNPVVSITSPVNNASFTAPANITINAAAADTDGTVSKVEFFNGSTKLGEDASSPYSFIWTNVAAGTYILTARAIDDKNGTTTSNAITIVVNNPNQAPVVAITSPVNNTSYVAAASITINATATDTDGNISKVEFYNGSTLLGTSTINPYSYNWSNVAIGTYNITAKAYDNLGLSTTSAAVTVKINANQTPVVSVSATSSSSNSVNISATATDGDGAIVKVEYYAGTTKIGESISSPYTFTWTNAPAGTHSITAVVTDDKGGKTTSSPVVITVESLNQNPTVTITSPVNNTSFTAPATIVFTSDAKDIDGEVVKVEYYAATAKIGESTISPFTLQWDGVVPGTYEIIAVAYDNVGISSSSSLVQITVDIPTNIIEDIVDSDVIVYPNPAMNIIHFKKEVSSVKIIDMMGNVLEYFQRATKSIDLSNYAEGTYILIAQYKDRTVVQRFVKTK